MPLCLCGEKIIFTLRLSASAVKHVFSLATKRQQRFTYAGLQAAKQNIIMLCAFCSFAVNPMFFITATTAELKCRRVRRAHHETACCLSLLYPGLKTVCRPA